MNDFIIWLEKVYLDFRLELEYWYLKLSGRL